MLHPKNPRLRVCDSKISDAKSNLTRSMPNISSTVPPPLRSTGYPRLASIPRFPKKQSLLLPAESGLRRASQANQPCKGRLRQLNDLRLSPMPNSTPSKSPNYAKPLKKTADPRARTLVEPSKRTTRFQFTKPVLTNNANRHPSTVCNARNFPQCIMLTEEAQSVVAPT